MQSETPKQPVRPQPPTQLRLKAPLQSTDFSRFVLEAIKASAAGTAPSTLDQEILRTALALSSSYLVADTSTNADPHAGSTTWFVGLNQLVDLLVVLHAREELEIETVNAASKVRHPSFLLKFLCGTSVNQPSQACSECWMAAGTWRGLEECRDGVRKVGAKLKNILDENGLTYRGETGL
ncbi:hypothetical protein B0H17DRAFT_1048658 [Mycena rosella]|uniref:Uncharacterized protein n=1 Tax=Mycena rosella TaxID=1033263 RepID=A0AAD7DVI5_MYCRO|nr:hypothetical protein B0H17DRAFT_1048658 [Mycena rosella]